VGAKLYEDFSSLFSFIFSSEIFSQANMTRSKQNLYPLPVEESRHYQRNGIRDARGPTKKNGHGRGNWGDWRMEDLDTELEMDTGSPDEYAQSETHTTSTARKVQVVDATDFEERKGYEYENENENGNENETE
jgi:hypothetical protein